MALHRDRGIEGMRGLAAFAVVVSHLALILLVTEDTGTRTAAQRLVGEGVLLLAHGVTVFFVLSGYLLYRPFAAHLLGGREPSVRSFYGNRALRILPAYWVILAICGWVLGATVVLSSQEAEGLDSLADSTGYLTDPLQILANVTLTQGYSTHTVGAISPAWSLVPEIAFYVLLPLLWLAARRLLRRPSFVAALAPALLLVVVGMVGYEVGLHFLLTTGEGKLFADTWQSRVFHSFIATCQLFGFGMVVAAVAVRLGDGTHRAGERRARRIAAALLAFCALAYLPARVLGQDRIVVGLAAAALILLMVVPGEGRLLRAWTGLLESRPLSRAGLISYSVYLWHYPLTAFLLKQWPALGFSTLGGFLVAAVIVIPLVIVLSELTYRFVERPALARKRSVVPAGERNTSPVATA